MGAAPETHAYPSAAGGFYPPQPPPKRKRWVRRHPVLTTAGALLTAVIIGGVAGGLNSTPTAVVVVSTPSPAAVHASTAQAVSPPPAPVVQAPQTPQLTVAQQQAVTAAQGYLALGSGFSRESLLQQLTSSYGDGFSQASAEFAVGYLHPDWDAQAVLAAKGYLALGEGFSAVSLEQQLTSSYGDSFTQAQAEYAVKQVGL